MVVRRTSLLFVLSFGCTFSGPVDDPEEASTSSATEANDDAIASGQSDDGHTSNTGAVTGVSATDATTASTGATTASTTANPTSADDASDDDPSADDDATASDTGTTGVGETGTPREQCGVEIPPGGGNYEVGCSCDGCELYWTDIDWDTYETIAAACECLCDAAGCGAHVSGEAAAADSDAEEGTASDGTASAGTESTGD
jgi:hypothetical protein